MQWGGHGAGALQVLTEPRELPSCTLGDTTPAGQIGSPLSSFPPHLGRTQARRLTSFPEGCISEFLCLLTGAVEIFWSQYAKRLETCKSAALRSAKNRSASPSLPQNCSCPHVLSISSCSLPWAHVSPYVPPSLLFSSLYPLYLMVFTPSFLFLSHISFVSSCSWYPRDQGMSGTMGCCSPKSGSTTYWYLQESRGVSIPWFLCWGIRKAGKLMALLGAEL